MEGDASLHESVFLTSLKACTKQKDLRKGIQLHSDILRTGFFTTSKFLGNTLINMYAKCGALAKAQQVFDELPIRNIISWTTLIACYCHTGYNERALHWYGRMQAEEVSPNEVTFLCIIKACGSTGAAKKGLETHHEVARMGLGRDTVIGTALVGMYTKCGELFKAKRLLEDLHVRDVVVWNALIAGYARHGYGEEALYCFEQLKWDGLFPNEVTFTCILKIYGSLRAPAEGKEIHHEVVRLGLLEKDNILGVALVDMYAKVGEFAMARDVLGELPVADLASWNVLISGCCELGRCELAFKYYEEMEEEGFSPNAATFASILKACGSLKRLADGKELHDEIKSKGLLPKDSVLVTSLVDMYAKCGAYLKAKEVFDEYPVRDVASWNALITGYCQQGHGEKALSCVELMKGEGLSVDTVTFVHILKACNTIRGDREQRELYTDELREGELKKDCVLGNALVDMYAKGGALVKAQEVFATLPFRSLYSWTTIIAGYCEKGLHEEALSCFEWMKHEGMSPDAVTLACILKVCGSIGAVEKGKVIHDEIVIKGLLGQDNVLGIALVDMYAKCGELAKAQDLFDKLRVRDTILYNALIGGYSQHGYSEEALDLFEELKCEGLAPDAVTFACALDACANSGVIEKGRVIHAEIAREDLVGKASMLGSALVDMYAKCGSLVNAQEAFSEIPKCDVVSWTALIAGYARVGRHGNVVGTFNKMIGEGIEPNLVTFTVVLSACSHCSLVEEGWMYFEMMRTRCGIVPSFKHYTCIMDLFSRAGQLDSAMALIQKMPSLNYVPLWFTLLGACQKWGNLKVGKSAFKHALHSDTKNFYS